MTATSHISQSESDVSVSHCLMMDVSVRMTEKGKDRHVLCIFPVMVLLLKCCPLYHPQSYERECVDSDSLDTNSAHPAPHVLLFLSVEVTLDPPRSAA